MIEQQHGEARYLQFSHFLQFPDLIHASFTRLGGYSKTPYQGLNVSYSIGDDFENVLRNRLLALKALQIQTYPCATLWMVHGAAVATLDVEQWGDWRTDWPHRSYQIDQHELIWTTKPMRKADALISSHCGVALAMSSADCVPLMFYDPVERVPGLAHAGWRGTARGIAAITIDAMGEQFGCRPGNIRVGIGPSIGPCCYEVTEVVRSYFMGQQAFDPEPIDVRYRKLVRESAIFTVKHIQGHDSLRLDLWETNRNQLLMAGVLPEHIESSEVCTSCKKEQFFS
ncbi:MAG TPA: polyphenol oxidase family protein, partial [Ktedonobacteraceae bacterium]|nr:polyphenol oxidase family protein [Ktedonobacteraceae bacterium]